MSDIPGAPFASHPHADDHGALPQPYRFFIDELGGPGMARELVIQHSQRDLSGWRPRAVDVPHWRDLLMTAWGPDGVFTRIAPTLSMVSGGRQRFVPFWECQSAADAALWYVGADMCALLCGAAPQLPATVLTDDLVPDECGLVIFETPLTGIDADGAGLGDVHVGALLWGPARWANTGEKVLGITVYGPLEGHQPHLQPLGGLVWPFGRSTDDGLRDKEFGGAHLTDEAVASMVEDRRRLLALWLLSTQPGLATSVKAAPSRAAARQAKRTGRDPQVRVVQLRHANRAEWVEGGDGWHYRHRFTVSGHWRNQAHGPGRQLRRPVYINPYLKGPEGAPLLDTPKVKAWTR